MEKMLSDFSSESLKNSVKHKKVKSKKGLHLS